MWRTNSKIRNESYHRENEERNLLFLKEILTKILTNLLLKMETFGQFDEPDYQMELDHRSKSTEFEFRDAMDCFWKTLQVCSHRK